MDCQEGRAVVFSCLLNYSVENIFLEAEKYYQQREEFSLEYHLQKDNISSYLKNWAKINK